MKCMLTVALMLGIFAPTARPQENQQRSDNSHFHTVSLIRLIANRADCDGEDIRVIGYLAGTGPDMALGVFVSESDGRNGVLTNAVGLHASRNISRDMIGKYVIISGVYHAPAPGGQFNGYIDHIVEVKLLHAGNTSK